MAAVAIGVRGCCSLSFPSNRKSSSSSSSSSDYYRRSRSRINASSLFWGSSKDNNKRNNISSSSSSSHQQQFSFNVTTTESEEDKIINVSFVSSISDIPSSQWDACALDATGPEKFNPFLSHAFLSSLELSSSSVKEKGWTPHHIVAKDIIHNHILAVVPLYLKTHSYGEFVFDHSWANAYSHFYGSNSYYPKLQSCVPFTPVTGPRILLRNTSFKHHVFDFIVSAIKDLTAMSQLSSFHVTFPSENEWHKFTQQGFLPRIGMQYHWTNRNYNNFDDFLMDMKHNKRKKIRQERKKVAAQNLIMKRLRGYEIKAKHWDSFYTFYRNTTDNKWGTPHLTREFFHEMGSKMGDQVLLIVAEDNEELVAGALNLIGGDTLFGRLWGCHPQTYYPFLHFEACYYQECNIDEISDEDEASAKSSKDKKSNGPDSGKASNLIFKITSKVPYKTIMKAQSTVLLKAESMVDKVEWINKLRKVAQAKGGQAIGEPSFPMRQSLSDGSLDTMARKPADPEEELRWMSQEVRGYVEAVLNSLGANVPKAVVLCQVEKAKEDMLNQLYSSISAVSSAKIEELLQEDQNVKRRRERAQKQSSLLSKLTRQLSVHDNRAAAASNWSDRGSAAESSPRSSGPTSGDDWRSAFDAAANGPSDSSSRYGSGGHSRRYSDPSQNGDLSSGSNSSSRRTPNRLPPAPPQSSSRY